MGRRLTVLLAAILAARAEAAPRVYLQLTSHNEQPSVPDTPNFTNAASQAAYIQWRSALKDVAEMCVARGIPYNCQCEWNFLEGVRKWEINPATAVPGITNNTGGRNILQYLQVLGQTSGVPIEIDPHSHEGFGYTYADVAWLIGQCGVTAAPVVGGHVWSYTNNTAVDFARLSAPTGVAPSKFAGLASNWFPQLLMGGGSTSHANDPHSAGLWRPVSATNYFTHAATGRLASIGGWQNDLRGILDLVERAERGELPTNQPLTAGLVMNHRDFQDDAYRSNTTRAVLDTLKAWQDAGRVQCTTYMGILGLWQTNYAGQSTLYVRPDDNASFSLNWQDFYYVEKSARYLDDLLTLHEDYQVPLDVFLTTWQTDILEQYPDLLGRLESSALVAQNYHVRAPKPYAGNFQWGPITNPATDKMALITNYESHGLSLTDGLPTSAAGGYAKLATLQGYAPVCVGALADGSLQSNVYRAFSNGGARMFVSHSPPVNVNQSDPFTHRPFRPEHWDWKLIALWETNASDPQPSTLTQTVAYARASVTNGGFAPWFVGVKLHDNDLYAEQSQWTLVYSNAWSRPWNTNQHAAALSAEAESNRYAFYAALVADAAARRTNVNFLNTFDIVAFLGDARARPLGLSRTAVYEAQPAGAVLATLSGGGTIAGQAVRYSLAAGDGDGNNADFTISSNRLLAAVPFDYEGQTSKHLRVRWEWVDALSTNVLASGDRALTLALRNVTSDDDDADGMTEAEESMAGTDPLDPDSYLGLLSGAPSPVDATFDLSVFGVDGRFYTLQSSTNLADWVTESPSVLVPGADAVLSLTDTNALPGSKFYRVVAGP